MRSFFALLVCALLALAPDADASAAKPKAKGPKKQRPFTSLETWVMVDPYTVPIIQDGRLRGRLSIAFGMDVTDDALREQAEALMPRLRDAWLARLNLYAATSLRPRRPGDVAFVSDILQKAADDVLGKQGSKVLIGSLIVSFGP